MLAAIPAAMVASVQVNGDRFCQLACVWFLIMSVFSMTPLLIKDGLIMAAAALSIFYLVGCGRVGYLRVVPFTPPASNYRRRIQPISR